MAQSGDWVGNLINWFIGYIIMGIWASIGYLLSIIGMWQMSADAIIGVVTDFKPADVGTSYTGSLTLGN